MNKKFYAIKIGNNVENMIVENWEECKKIVIGYPSVYKGFCNKKEAEKWLKSLSEEQVEYMLKWNEIERFKRLKEKLQIEYGFKIPDYIIDEIINNNNYDNLCALINLAVMNKRLTRKDAKILKEKEYKKLNMIQSN